MSGKHMAYQAGSGAMGLLKDGYKHYSGVQEAVLKNTGAIKEFSELLRTSMGPNGMNKMVINHLDKLFVTSDAATIVGSWKCSTQLPKWLSWPPSSKSKSTVTAPASSSPLLGN